MVSPKPRRTLSGEDWLAAALEALRESGVDGVKVLPLARRLGVSRGSFYWHFRDRGELLAAVLDYWDRWSTEVVIDALDASKDEPESRPSEPGPCTMRKRPAWCDAWIGAGSPT